MPGLNKGVVWDIVQIGLTEGHSLRKIATFVTADLWALQANTPHVAAALPSNPHSLPYARRSITYLPTAIQQSLTWISKLLHHWNCWLHACRKCSSSIHWALVFILLRSHLCYPLLYLKKRAPQIKASWSLAAHTSSVQHVLCIFQTWYGERIHPFGMENGLWRRNGRRWGWRVRRHERWEDLVGVLQLYIIPVILLHPLPFPFIFSL